MILFYVLYHFVIFYHTFDNEHLCIPVVSHLPPILSDLGLRYENLVETQNDQHPGTRLLD